MTLFEIWVERARMGWDRTRSFATGRIEAWRDASPWQIAALVALGLLALVLLLPLALAAVLVLLVAGLIVFWIGEFVGLMRLPDEAFPGRHDKLVWSILMIVLPPVGAIAFWIYRRRDPLLGWPDKPRSPWHDDDL
ncbi:MAG: hypothetical protein KatS3mg108_2218 [Isosphaeraceae bacterium]|jgi:uncharacterized membrane protein YhaH (DUF805 family)|nr:MAG: hypothetical protein KatS3mg108_2218 [Isosphaeraceae bacterium]